MKRNVPKSDAKAAVRRKADSPLTPFNPDEGDSGEKDGILSDLLNIDELSQALRKSTCQIRRLTKMGKLPKPIHIGATPLWPKEVIQAWIRRQIEGCGS